MAGRTMAIVSDNGLIEFSEVPTTTPRIQITISDHDDAGIIVLSLTEARQAISVLTTLVRTLDKGEQHD